MLKLITKKEEKLFKYLNQYEGLGFNKIQALFRKKDIKINGKRAKEDQFLNVGDQIELYCPFNYFFDIKKIYEDDNILIVFKPKKLEVVSQTKNISLLNLLNPEYFAVHRLDFNTEGLVVFAKNLISKHELDNAFKNSEIEKHYITICKNFPYTNELTFQDFLVKNEKNVKIYKNQVPNSKKIITKIKVLKKSKDFCLLDINLLTGRTHQIRAHLSFHNLPVVGDEKYGDFQTNKKLQLKSQILRCYQIKFNNFKNNLKYLNDKKFVITTDDIYKHFEQLNGLYNI